MGENKQIDLCSLGSGRCPPPPPTFMTHIPSSQRPLMELLDEGKGTLSPSPWKAQAPGFIEFSLASCYPAHCCAVAGRHWVGIHRGNVRSTAWTGTPAEVNAWLHFEWHPPREHPGSSRESHVMPLRVYKYVYMASCASARGGTAFNFPGRRTLKQMSYFLIIASGSSF